MSNVVTPQAFATFPPPYRMQVVYDRLEAELSHLLDVDVTMEPLVMEDSDRQYPHLQFDTCRVWARRGTLSANVHGVIQDGSFFYRLAVYDGDTPKGLTDVRMTNLSDLIAHAKAVF
ncbi:hypothetical protein GGQ91_005069 [Methylobacterium fujisawaense]|uniref:Uncharacterized protein n=1 Tax=Methylobacterium fujisawaense TaxID=107400 RepID=A0ABR6DHT6_9HYPH|nr:hypothetical protein [Methylobacterium fujisawaense]MBA9065647.1 hypothetical protein [Methylobacterium fujisawaense]